MTLTDDGSGFALASRLRGEFGWKRRLSTLEFLVDATTGVVTVPYGLRPHDRTLVKSIASRTPGVTRVRVGRIAMSASRTKTSDARLAERVVEALAATSHVHTSSPKTRVSVRAINGIVTLRGHVGVAYEREAARRVAANVFGVARVELRIRVNG